MNNTIPLTCVACDRVTVAIVEYGDVVLCVDCDREIAAATAHLFADAQDAPGYGATSGETR